MAEGRVPPQNIEAEQSVLGAMMLKQTAVTQALELIASCLRRWRDLCTPASRWILSP